jgi:hypothetical protein
MVSFYIVALFPNILINFALEFMNDWLLSLNLEDGKRSAFMEIAESCMALNFFTFRKYFYKQTSGTSMGNPISPIIANIFMSRFGMDLASANLLPCIWYRYVDDIFAVIKKTDVQNTLNMLNSQYNTIKFTVEEECDQKLPFLDICVRRESDAFKFTVHRKPTSTNRYIKDRHLFMCFHRNLLPSILWQIDSSTYQ